MNQSNIYSAGQLGLASALTSQSIEQCQKQTAVPAPDTIRSLTERAHQAIEVLEHELGRLVDFTYPVREPMPCGPEESGANPPSGPEAISLLRALIARIDSQTRTVRQIAAELRV
ncbi:hypothetical protein WT15_27360 [Burkholderia stagnalis]|uniref:hypothetical protein n=1 Tax=Burkholderia stagnalis TaxID=1503054 RepID=UPI000753BBAD|nr:hypothetical protein [Burkholderia stagnalis]KVN72798.1 hypothetical protein WT15_27360 [Burkholderia stagnalis]KWO38178.1 hypothetical protein WT96_12725 [Burkholderia stagnalis]KWO41100.1 hypothetical protein WT95_03120 [Burkholderia stagnalis]